ncbi:IS630 transposase-related protein [Candidatus Albibeggiatoa sp. nov. BB20]|uniref:IS630 transposase-related protein n=1 Tax=Candidatus Albibeggiatoa sp. nov. BB20 TaxID=3162723 RepID=UPI0033654B45
MKKRYSEDLKERVVTYVEEGGRVKDAVRIFKVTAMSISRWRRRKAETGELKNKARKEWARKVNQKALKEYVKKNPEHLLSEMSKKFGVSSSTIHRNLTALGIVYTKNSGYAERNEEG